MSQILDSIHHRLNRERGMCADMTADMYIDMATDMVANMDVDVVDDVDDDSPCFHGPVSCGQIFSAY
jgi:hypothetical protein